MDNTIKTNHNPPSEDELKTSLKQLFDDSRQLEKTMVMECIYPRDVMLEKDLPEGNNQITFAPFWEIDELNAFVQLHLDHFKFISDYTARARICLVLYCHILEADFPMAVIYNLLRILGHEKPSWMFLGLDEKQKEKVCQYPSGKICEILRRSAVLKQPIGAMLDRMWKSAIRNSFMHSNYMLTSDRFIPTKGLSPISRNNINSMQENLMNPTPTIEDIICHGFSAVSFLSSFNHEYKIYRELYPIDFTRK